MVNVRIGVVVTQNAPILTSLLLPPIDRSTDRPAQTTEKFGTGRVGDSEDEVIKWHAEKKKNGKPTKVHKECWWSGGWGVVDETPHLPTQHTPHSPHTIPHIPFPTLSHSASQVKYFRSGYQSS